MEVTAYPGLYEVTWSVWIDDRTCHNFVVMPRRTRRELEGSEKEAFQEGRGQL